MKRIVNGVTYNTATSTCLAKWEKEDEESIVSLLYQTRGGAFFFHHETTKKTWDEGEREYTERVTNEFEPAGPDEAHKWLMDGDIEIFSNPFEDPPEAAAEAEPGATIYVRVPASLKKRVDDAAKKGGVSGNVWAMRCLERCAADA